MGGGGRLLLPGVLPLLLSSGAPAPEPPAAGARRSVDPAERRRLQEWLVRLADGDRSAFEPLFAALWPLLSCFAARLLPSAADAEDAAQQALLKLFARASAFDRERDALAWAMGIAAWECRTVRKRAARRREEPLGDATDATVPSAEAEVIERDLLAAVREVLGGLRPEETEAILAAAHGRRPSGGGAAFRKRLERARRRLRDAWRIKHGTE